MEFNSAVTPLVKTDPVRKRDLRSAMFSVSQNTSFQTQLFSVHELDAVQITENVFNKPIFIKLKNPT